MESEGEIVAEDLNIWLARVKQATSRAQMFKILDEFRKHEWTDVQCQTMSHLYMRLLQFFEDEEDPTDTTGGDAAATATGGVPANDGPVWYEKM